MQGQTVKIGGGQVSANSGQEEIEVAGTVLLTEGFVAESHLEDFLNCKDKLRWMNMIYLDTMAITSTLLQPRLQSGLSSRWEQATGAKIICWDLSPIKANDNFLPNSDWQNICQQDVRNTWWSSDNSVHDPAQCWVSDSLGPGRFIANNIDFLMGHRHQRSIISGFSILNVITAPTGGALPAECEWRWIETCWL